MKTKTKTKTEMKTEMEMKMKTGFGKSPGVVTVHDKMQDGYRYERTEPAGRNFAPEFKPELTPKQMLALGVFGGKYLTDCVEELPQDWFETARLSPKKAVAEKNFFGVLASQPRREWLRKGWIHPDDPRGWFQWYCRYFLGRRHPDDARQIRRWHAMKRHAAQLRKHCLFGDLTCRPRQRQALLQWAYRTFPERLLPPFREEFFGTCEGEKKNGP